MPGADPQAHKVTPDQVASVPLQALLRGMLREDVRAREPRPVQLSGLMSVMREQLLAAPNVEERFGERSYAIISDKYLNFSSRVGYHYSVLDAYCGATVNKNYITFSFKGGAADDVRRSRRVRAIAIVLMGLDFSVEVKGDRVDARLQKYEAPVIQAKLDLIGRLLIFTRQMDMLMTSEAGVEAVAQNFLQGNYSLDMAAIAVPDPHPPPKSPPGGFGLIPISLTWLNFLISPFPLPPFSCLRHSAYPGRISACSLIVRRQQKFARIKTRRAGKDPVHRETGCGGGETPPMRALPVGRRKMLLPEFCDNTSCWWGSQTKRGVQEPLEFSGLLGADIIIVTTTKVI